MPKHLTDGQRVAAAIRDSAIPAPPRRTDRVRPEKRKRLPLGLWWRKTFFVFAGASASATQYRRSLPIHAYVGPNGGGKSLAAVKDTLPALHAGKPVLSTVPIWCWCGDPEHRSIPWTHLQQLLDFHDGEVVADEMVGIVNSRESMGLDPRIQNVLVQLRRRGVVFRWTAPNFARADKIIREVTQAVTECRGSFPDRRDGGVDQWGEPLIWAPKRLFHWRTFDVNSFEEWTSGKRDKAEVECTEWYYAPDDPARDCYDTMGAVEAVAGMAKNSECPHCGGTVSKPRCRCKNERGGEADPWAAFEASAPRLEELERGHVHVHEDESEAVILG